MKSARLVGLILMFIAVAGVGFGAYLTSERWLPWVRHRGEEAKKPADDGVTPSEKIIVNDQAQKNLGLMTADGKTTAKYLKAETFPKTISVPGMVVDRLGVSDRGIVSPATAVVSTIHHVPGDTVRPGDVLFTLRLLSESLHLTQKDLRKTVQDIKLNEAERKRLMEVSSVIPAARLIEVENQLARLETAAKAYSEELLNRGLSDDDITAIGLGHYVKEIKIVAPPRAAGAKPLTVALLDKRVPPAFELQELKVEVGQQVQAGQTLGILANHQSLSIEGRAFPDEAQLVERSFKERWPVAVDFLEDGAAGWDESNQAMFIKNIANSFDPVNRTVGFLLPLENQSKAVKHDDTTKLVWRYRPGQKVHLRVRAEEMKNVFVLPADAVVRDGAEAFVFTQNVNTFERKSVIVLFQERDRIVIANDGSLDTYAKEKEGSTTVPKEKETWTIPIIAQVAAAQLNRMGKAGSSGVPKGYHIHADGSLHKNEDEGK
jgi:membrane fusion protein, heavy metal efflux system